MLLPFMSKLIKKENSFEVSPFEVEVGDLFEVIAILADQNVQKEIWKKKFFLIRSHNQIDSWQFENVGIGNTGCSSVLKFTVQY